MVDSLYCFRKCQKLPRQCSIFTRVRPGLEYYCHIWAGSVQSSLSRLDRVKKIKKNKHPRCLVNDGLFSTLQISRRTKCHQPFTTMSLLLWQMFKRVTFLSPSPAMSFTARIHHIMFTVANPSPFHSRSYDNKQVPLRQLLLQNFGKNASLITIILVSLSPGSTDIYPSCPHNTLSLPFQSHSVNLYLE